MSEPPTQESLCRYSPLAFLCALETTLRERTYGCIWPNWCGNGLTLSIESFWAGLLSITICDGGAKVASLLTHPSQYLKGRPPLPKQMCFAFWDILDLGLSNLTHPKNTESTCMHETDGRIYYVAAGLPSKAFISKTETCPQVGQVGQWIHHMFILCAKLLYVNIFVSNCKMYLSQLIHLET